VAIFAQSGPPALLLKFWARTDRVHVKSPSLDLANLQTEITELRRRIASIEAARPNDAAADTIEQFCSRWGISRAHFYVLKAAGKGPREMRPGVNGKGPILISRQAQDEWRRECEAETNST